jgi:hypothetical protein
LVEVRVDGLPTQRALCLVTDLDSPSCRVLPTGCCKFLRDPHEDVDCDDLVVDEALPSTSSSSPHLSYGSDGEHLNGNTPECVPDCSHQSDRLQKEIVQV